MGKRFPPAPWCWKTVEEGYGPDLVAKDGTVVVAVDQWWCVNEDAKPLLEAAPDLYSALRRLVFLAQRRRVPDHMWPKAWDTAVKALEKAEGGCDDV